MSSSITGPASARSSPVSTPPGTGPAGPGAPDAPGNVPSGTLDDVQPGTLAPASADHAKSGRGRHVASEKVELAPGDDQSEQAARDAIVTLSGLGASSAVNIQAIAEVLNSNVLESRKAMKLDRAEKRDAVMQADQAAADDTKAAGLDNLIATEVSAGIAIAGAAVTAYGAVKAAPAKESFAPEEESGGGVATPSLDNEAPIAPRSSTAATAKSENAGGTNAKTAEAVEKGNQSESKIEESITDKRLTKAQDSAAESQRKMALYNSLGQGITELGKMGGGISSYEATQKDADKLEQQAEATKQQAAADSDSDFIKTYSDDAAAIADKLSSMLQARAQADQAIAGNARA